MFQIIFNMKKLNKKGLGSELKDIIIYSLIILIGIYFIWTYLLHGAGDTIGNLQTCGSLAVGKGVCRESCNADYEASFPGIGCIGVKSTCCISTTGNFLDTVLPAPYGGDISLYNFDVKYIGLKDNTKYDSSPDTMKADVGQCVFEDKPTDTSLRCIQGTKVTLMIKIGVAGTGVNPVKVYASPVTVVNDNPDSKKQAYQGITPATLAKGATTEVYTIITINPADAQPNSWWKIYPYAACIEPECKKTDISSRGIMKNILNNPQIFSVKFVDKLN